MAQQLEGLYSTNSALQIKMMLHKYGFRFAFRKSLVRLHNSLGSCESILGNLPRGQFYLTTPAAFTLFIPNCG